MALTIQENKEEAGGNKVTSDRRLYVNAAGNALVEEGDPDARVLFCAAGKPVMRADLERFGVEMKSAEEIAVEKAEADQAEAEKAEEEAAVAAEKAEADAAAEKSEADKVAATTGKGKRKGK